MVSEPIARYTLQLVVIYDLSLLASFVISFCCDFVVSEHFSIPEVMNFLLFSYASGLR